MDGVVRFGSLFTGDDRYAIPTYQRGYSWGKEHVGQFLDDLELANITNNNTYKHYFGSVLITKPNRSQDRTIKIIDGQQRMTTATLFLLCLRNFFETYKDNSPLAADYCRRMEEHIYASPYAAPDLNKPVIMLSRTNNKFFRDILNHRSFTTDVESVYSESNDSNESLSAAFKEIRVWIQEKSCPNKNNLTDDASIDPIQKIFGYYRTLTCKFFVSILHCDNESEAYRIFNLVNNRGARLNDSDLIKNYLFGALEQQGVSPDDIDTYDEKWDEMRHLITSKQYADYKLDRFFYHYLLACHSHDLVKTSDLNDTAQTPDPDDPPPSRLKQKHLYESFDYLVDEIAIVPDIIISELRDLSSILKDIRNPNGNFLQKDSLIHYLKKIRSVKAVFVYPAILAGYIKYWKTKDYKSFEALVMMCFKYHVRVKVIGTSISLSDYQARMYDIMDEIKNDVPIKQIITNLIRDDAHYPDPQKVFHNLTTLRVSNSKLAIALLEEAEYSINKKRSPDDVSIEHIMPKKFQPWQQYIIDNNPELSNSNDAKAFHEQYFNMLGNQTLLSGKDNTSISNLPFDQKQTEYANHKTFAITKELCNIQVWNKDSIKKRQEDLASAILDEIDLNKIIIDLNL